MSSIQRSYNGFIMRLAVLFIVGLACHGQIHNLATTDDGRQLYFSSPQRLKGTSLDDTAKIFRLVDSGFELFAYTGPRSNTPFAVGYARYYLLRVGLPERYRRWSQGFLRSLFLLLGWGTLFA